MLVNFTNFESCFDFNAIQDGTAEYNLTLGYKFAFSHDSKHYENNIWQSRRLYDVNAEDDSFSIKVPLFLQSYSLEFQLHIARIEEHDTFVCSSEKCTAIIPSVLVQSASFNIGECVDFYPEHDNECVEDGVIVETLSEGEKYKIRNLHTDELLTVEASKVIPASNSLRCIVDITNNSQAMTDLILGTEDEHKLLVYAATFDGFAESSILQDEFYQVFGVGGLEEFHPMAAGLASIVHAMLYRPDFTYRVECVHDGKCLVCRNSNDSANNPDNTAGYAARAENNPLPGMFRYACDLCRTEQSWNGFMYHCDAVPSHDFCLSCIHCIVAQYTELKPFLCHLLDDTLDRGSIQQIVAFCVGKVVRFDHAVIARTSKRRMDSDQKAEPLSKRRKL